MAKQRHYQTKHILYAVRQRGTGEAILKDGAGGQFTEAMNPRPIAELASDLDAIFHAGGVISFSRDFGWDDEGGNCHEVFIVKAEHLNHWDNVVAATDADSMAGIRHLAENPGMYWLLWSGPQ